MTKDRCYKKRRILENKVFEFTVNVTQGRVFGVMTVKPVSPMGRCVTDPETNRGWITFSLSDFVEETFVYKAGILCSPDDDYSAYQGISICQARLLNMYCTPDGAIHKPDEVEGTGWHRYKEWAKNGKNRTDEVSEVDTVHDRRGVSNPGTKGKRITVTPTRSPEEVQRDIDKTPDGRLFIGGADFGESGEVVIFREDDETIHEQLVRDIEKAGEDLEEGVTGH